MNLEEWKYNFVFFRRLAAHKKLKIYTNILQWQTAAKKNWKKNKKSGNKPDRWRLFSDEKRKTTHKTEFFFHNRKKTRKFVEKLNERRKKNHKKIKFVQHKSPNVFAVRLWAKCGCGCSEIRNKWIGIVEYFIEIDKSTENEERKI